MTTQYESCDPFLLAANLKKEWLLGRGTKEDWQRAAALRDKWYLSSGAGYVWFIVDNLPHSKAGWTLDTWDAACRLIYALRSLGATHETCARRVIAVYGS